MDKTSTVAIRHAFSQITLLVLMTVSTSAIAEMSPGSDWTLQYTGNKGELYIKECRDSKIDNCPTIRLLFKEPSEQFNFIYFDYIITDYVGRLEKLGHQNISYELELGSSLNTIHVTSSRDQIHFKSVILVSKKKIRYLEYSAGDAYFQSSLQEFNGFLQRQKPLQSNLDRSLADDLTTAAQE